MAPNRAFVVLDQSPDGGAWRHFRWPSLTLSTLQGESLCKLPAGSVRAA